MTGAALPRSSVSGDPYQLNRSDSGGGSGARVTGHGSGGPAPKRIITAYGFWVFLLSDIIMFAAFFATFAVLQDATDGGPTGPQLFDTTRAAIETGCLLLSSYFCGAAAVASSRRNMMWTQLWLLATGVLGAAFLLLELQEFGSLLAQGAGPQRSAFLSSFWALVGCHGLHVGIGLLWLGTMMAQLWSKGFRADIMRRLTCFILFWHALDIVWVAIFSIVYLMGGR